MKSFRMETFCEYLRHRSFNSWCLQVSGSYSLIRLPLTFAGLIMVLAWMVFSSVGMTIARFFKSEWSDKTILGQKVWFQVLNWTELVLHLQYRSSIITYRNDCQTKCWDMYIMYQFIDYTAPGSQSLHGVGAGIDSGFFFHHYSVCGGIQRCKI